ncbi:MAG TPA: phosphatase PAP2 family protein [Cytophagaceae bacterium]|nr:phosphatase PAP2 family protein [Cytophagaceae bacterium]
MYFLIAGLLVWMQEKGTAVLFFNRNYHPFLDWFFKIVTYLGDGWFAIPLISFLLLFRNIFKGIVMLASVLLSFLVVQTLKIVVFPNMPRPSKYFPESMKLYYVEGVEIHTQNSFPSGHSAQAFAIFLLLALFTKNKNWSVFYFLTALLVTISRMYLAQHFLIDTYFGALIATLVTFFTYYYFTNHTTLAHKERWQRGWLV